MREDWAHTGHLLRDHLETVAQDAAASMDGTPSAQWAYLAGLWHDLGKYRPGFQDYIRVVSDAHIEGKLPSNSEKTHSAAGALHALRTMEERFGPAGALLGRVLAYVIAGHHAGLADWVGGLDQRLVGTGAKNSACEYDEALAACSSRAPDLLAIEGRFDLASAMAAIPRRSDPSRPEPLAVSVWIRMLFSALVDADFLDTERFLSSGRSSARSGFQPLADYASQLDAHLQALADQAHAQGRSKDPVMRARDGVLLECRRKAALPPGVFTLTVPTGGGKTLSSLAFALSHAMAHGKRRVIYAIPYTSIIEQTAEVFAGIFGADNLVEHHSQADAPPEQETAASRLACENWDAPLVVTTTVQLFESLFASRTSRCRKLHRLRDSVIVLDEAQLLPPSFLQPILDVLNALLEHHGVTLVLCTATQPALTSHEAFDPRQRRRGLPEPTPIVDDEAALFNALERVTIRWPADLNTAIEWPALVDELQTHDCVLTIVNTRKDAHELTCALPQGTLHLSAAMCGAHRKDVIDEVRRRLHARQNGDATPLRVVSTQLIEAGVDVDFPVVYRALAGLDSIAQSAGRCNREGRLAHGEVVVFVRNIPKTLAQLQAGVATTRSVCAEGLSASPGPADFTRYFKAFYRSQKLDARDIVAELEDRDGRLEFNFRTAADKFRLVDDEDQGTLIVPYQLVSDTPDEHQRLAGLLGMLSAGKSDRWLLRDAQRYAINVRMPELRQMQVAREAREVMPGIYVLEQDQRYDVRFGLLPRDPIFDPGLVI